MHESLRPSSDIIKNKRVFRYVSTTRGLKFLLNWHHNMITSAGDHAIQTVNKKI